MPRYEWVTELRNRFWSIWREGARLSITQGKRGTGGAQTTETFPTEAAAREREAALIAERLAEGYRLVEPDKAQPPKPKRHLMRFEQGSLWLEFTVQDRLIEWNQGGGDGNEDAGETEYASAEQAKGEFDQLEFRYNKKYRLVRRAEVEPVARAPRAVRVVVESDDEDLTMLDVPETETAWLVYRDARLSAGDPRGDWASWVSRGAEQAEKRQLFRELGKQLFGDELIAAGIETELVAVPTGESADEYADVALELLHNVAGFPVAARIFSAHDLRQARLVELLLEAPIASVLTSLRFGLDAKTWDATIEAVGSSRRASQLRALEFNQFDVETQEISWVEFGDFSRLWRRVPSLEHLHIKSGAGGVLGAIEAPKLKRFIRESGGLRATELSRMVEARWPMLEHLEVWLGSSSYGADTSVDDVRPLLTGELPQLRYLGLKNTELVDELIPLLAKSRLLRQLRVLDLSMSVLVDEGTLLRHAKSFEHLEVLDLRQNQLSEDAAAEIKAALPCALVDDQREGDQRYVAVGE